MNSYKQIFALLFALFASLTIAQKDYPQHWGEPPKMETMDLRVREAKLGGLFESCLLARLKPSFRV